jgi:hypothetical protein
LWDSDASLNPKKQRVLFQKKLKKKKKNKEKKVGKSKKEKSNYFKVLAAAK